MRAATRRIRPLAGMLGLIVCLGVGRPTLAASPGQAATVRDAATEAWAVVLDPQVARAIREQTLLQIERNTNNDDQHALYLLGSLYLMGERASGAPVQKDLDKAAIYLGNAAINGSLLAMAKMAEIDLAAHKYRESMIWAQVYGHYAMLLPTGERPPNGYTAELVQRIIDKLGRSGVTDAMPEVANFIATHDAAIRAGTSSHFGGKALHPKAKEKAFITPNYRFAPQSGLADYLLAFRPDGSVAHAWLLDAVPDPGLGEALQQHALDMTLPPAKGKSSARLRYAWLPVVLDDRRYRVSPSRQAVPQR